MAMPTTYIPHLFYLPIILRNDLGCNMREVLDLFKAIFSSRGHHGNVGSAFLWALEHFDMGYCVSFQYFASIPAD
jgi:hypothetical protein